MQKKGYKTIKQIKEKREKESSEDFLEYNRPRGYNHGVEYYENIHNAVDDLNVNKQIYNAVVGIQSSKQFDMYMESHNKVILSQ